MTERIWDRFLTDADKAHLATGRRRPVGFGKRPALLLVDLYRAVFGDRREPLLEAIKTWPFSCGPVAWDAVPHIQTLLSVAREVRIPIVHVTMLTGTGVNGWMVRRDSEPASPPLGLEDRNDLYEIIPDVGPLPGEAVIRKAAPSAFWGTPLTGHLTFNDIDTVIVCGESTSGCVRATVIDSTTNRFRTIVVEEGVFDRHESAHAMNLFDMHQKYADVLPITEVVQYLRSWRVEQDAPGAGDKRGLAENLVATAVRG